MMITRFRRIRHWIRRNTEVSTLVAVGVVVLGFWGLAEFVNKVVEGGTSNLVRDLLLARTCATSAA